MIEKIEAEVIKQPNQVHITADEEIIQAVMMVLGRIRGNSEIGRLTGRFYSAMTKAGVSTDKEYSNRVRFRTTAPRSDTLDIYLVDHE